MNVDKTDAFAHHTVGFHKTKRFALKQCRNYRQGPETIQDFGSAMEYAECKFVT